MTRYRAASIHLAMSAAIVGTVLAIVFLFWYPGFSFRISGAVIPVFVLVGVDLVLGPTLTLIVYVHGKWGLKFDLFFIAVVQLTALLYGSYTLYAERPSYMVFAVDRVSLVGKKAIDPTLIAYDEILDMPIGRMQKVFARKPVGDAYQTFLDSVLFQGKPDLEYRTEFWEPWQSGKDIIRSSIQAISDFEPADSEEQDEIANAVRTYGDAHPNLGFIPIGGIEDDIGLLMDIDTLLPLGVIEINPWERPPSE
jgi:hypothetical protein